MAQAINATVTDGSLRLEQIIPEAQLWQWFRDQADADPYRTAKMMGLPSLTLTLSQRPIKVQTIIDNYKRENPAYKRGNVRGLQIFEAMIKNTGAKTLDDLTQNALTDWRNYSIALSSATPRITIAPHWLSSLSSDWIGFGQSGGGR
jgi:hypothetical protein